MEITVNASFIDTAGIIFIATFTILLSWVVFWGVPALVDKIRDWWRLR